MFLSLWKKAPKGAALTSLVLLAALLFAACPGPGDPVTQPVITSQPVDGFYNIWLPGSHAINTAKLSVSASGGGLSYQWYSNTSASNTGGTLMPGKTTSTLSLTKADMADISNGANYFYVEASNSAGIIISDAVTVTVDGVAMDLVGIWAAGFGDDWRISPAYHLEYLGYGAGDFAGDIQYVSFFDSSSGVIIIKYDPGRELIWYSGDPNTGNYYGIYFEDLVPQSKMYPSGTSYVSDYSYGPSETENLNDAINRFTQADQTLWMDLGYNMDYIWSIYP